MSSPEGSFPEDATMHLHGGLIADATPCFLRVQEGKGQAHGVLVLHWSEQACFTAMATAMDKLRAMLTRWELEPLEHTVLNTYSQGGLPAQITHGVAFKSTEEVHRLSNPQLDIIHRELDVSRRYPGTAKAVPVLEGMKLVNHRITVTRLVNPDGPVIFADSLSEATKYFHSKENLSFAFTPGVKNGFTPAAAQKDVWSVAKHALASVNAHLGRVDFV